MLDPDFFGHVVEHAVPVTFCAPKACCFLHGFLVGKIAVAEFLPDIVQFAAQVDDVVFL